MACINNDTNELSIYDPFIQGTPTSILAEQHMLWLEKLENEFLKPYTIEKGKEDWLSLHKKINLPPEIPEQLDSWNCGIFMIEFIRHLMNETDFLFSGQDLGQSRKRMIMELQNVRLEPFEIISQISSSQSCKVRVFVNRDKKTCWLISCLQLLMNALDYAADIKFSSSLGKYLMKYKSETKINPMKVKELLQKQLEQKPSTLDIDNIMMEEQCVRDFFILLSGNGEVFHDIINAFQHTILQKITCPTCKQSSLKQEKYLYMEENVPDNNSALKNYLEKLFNDPQIAEDYLCECGQRNNCEKKISLVTSKSSNFLLVILLRVNISYFDVNKQHQITINSYSNEVDVTHDIEIIDVEGKTVVYQPIGVIPHIGNVLGHKSSGHYICDLKLKNNTWVRTSDESKAIVLNIDNVTRHGYVILLKRKFLKTNQT